MDKIKNFAKSKTFTVNAVIAGVFILLCFLGIFLYINHRFNTLAGQIENTNNALSTLEQSANDRIQSIGEILSENLTDEQQKNLYLRDQLSEITNTVGALAKLSTIDPELLKKYSKVYFLNEHYVPISLTNIPEEYINEKATNFQIHSDVLPHLKELIGDARDDDLTLQVQSAYRSFATQSTLKANNTVVYGAGTANRFSADQGYSEHQLGTAMDFTTGKLDSALEGFDKTPEYAWLLDNAHKYGFILSYPTGNTYYKFEPWHWRFVGVKLAERLHDDNVYFYGVDQRMIDGYLANIFD